MERVPDSGTPVAYKVVPFRSVFFAYYGGHGRNVRPILNFRIFSEVKEDDRREPQQPYGCEDSMREPDAEIGKKPKFIDNTERKD